MTAAQQQSSNEFKQLGYEKREVKGHNKRICTLSWCSSGRKVATGSQDTSVRIWSIEPYCPASRHERCDELRGHQAVVTHVAWKPGSEAALASVAGDKNDKTLRLWDVKSGKATSVVSMNSNPLCVTWSPDGLTLAVLATTDDIDSLSIVDVRKAKVVKTHKFNVSVNDIHWGPTPQHMLLGTGKGSVDVMSLTSMETLWSLVGHTTYCTCFATAHDYKYLVSGGADALVALWDLDEAVCMRTWAHMDHVVRSVSISHDKAYIAYATEGRELEILGLRTGERVQELSVRVGADTVAWSPTHNVLAWVDEVLDATRYEPRSIGAVLCIYAPAKT